MSQRIGIVAASASARRGVASLLADGGFGTVELETLAAWRPGRGGIALVVVVRGGDEREALARFAEDHPAVPVLAMVPTPDLVAVSGVLRAGAVGALGEDEPAGRLVAAVRAVVEGLSVVAPDILKALVARVPEELDPGLWLNETEQGWLRSLSEGVTVPRLAETVGYSEREMFRVLRRLYLRLGVRGRTGAIVWATRHGLI